MTLRRSPLDHLHRALDAKMVPFGGWEMPLSYASGTVAEHLACRQRAVVFDVSHLGTLRVTGPGALSALQGTLTNDLGRIEPGRAQYTHLLDEHGSVLDDIIVWWVSPDAFDVMPNASNTQRVADALSGAAGALGLGSGDLTLTDVTSLRALLAVQGPQARTLLSGVAPEAATVGRFGVGPFTWDGHPGVVAGTGYTGEDGVELAVSVAGAEALWQALVDAGASPAGLGARDTLRLEAGLPLHGHELGPGITPLQAGLGWVVAWDKPTFAGREALLAERAAGPARRLRGIRSHTRRPLRDGQEVLFDGSCVGVLTSGSYSPVLGRGIGLGLLDPTVEVGASVQVDVRGTAIDADVVAPPFHTLEA